MQNLCQNETWKKSTERTPKWCKNGNQNLVKNYKWNEKDMQKNNAETGCSERLPKTCKGKEKEVTGRKSEAGGNFGARPGHAWATLDGVGGGLPALKGGDPSTWAPHRQSRHMSARFGKRAGACLHVRPKRGRKVKNPAAGGVG